MEPRDFVDIITDVRGGTCHHELSLAMQEATKAAIETGKKASVSVTLNIKPQGNKQVELLDVISKKIPEPAKPSTFMFVDRENNLTRDDRRQMKLSEVEVKRKEAVELPEEKPKLKEVAK